ncbi:MAG: hypothetical protein K2Q34_08920 [Alphaproteobacteria bacterium]|nr:hypothetical protein [Alphaproteobacteria bacterium]
MKQNHPWTEQELSQIKADYLKGEKIKIMAHRLNRSANSINKALSRYGIRNSKIPTKGYIEWDPAASYCRGKIPPIIEHKSLKPKEKIFKNTSSHSFKTLKRIKKINQDNPWVSLRDVVDYIKSKGIGIQAFRLNESAIPSAYNEATFFLDHKPCSPLKVALFANKLRLEEGKQTFLIKGVTW